MREKTGFVNGVGEISDSHLPTHAQRSAPSGVAHRSSIINASTASSTVLYRLHLVNNIITVNYQSPVGNLLCLVRPPNFCRTYLLIQILGLSHPPILGYRRPTLGRMILPQQPLTAHTLFPHRFDYYYYFLY